MCYTYAIIYHAIKHWIKPEKDPYQRINAKVFSKVYQQTHINGLIIEPLPLALIRSDGG